MNKNNSKYSIKFVIIVFFVGLFFGVLMEFTTFSRNNYPITIYAATQEKKFEWNQTIQCKWLDEQPQYCSALDWNEYFPIYFFEGALESKGCSGLNFASNLNNKYAGHTFKICWVEK